MEIGNWTELRFYTVVLRKREPQKEASDLAMLLEVDVTAELNVRKSELNFQRSVGADFQTVERLANLPDGRPWDYNSKPSSATVV